MKLVKITIKDGRAKVEVDGCQDSTCKDVTEAIERALGKTESTDYKPEFFQERSQDACQ